MNKIDDSRESILAKIKAAKPEARPLPEIPEFKIPGDPLRNFAGHLKGYDGSYRMFETRSQAIDWINRELSSSQASIYSNVKEIKGNASDEDFECRADMHTIEICVAEASMGIGETGSLLVDNTALGTTAAALFATDMILLIDRTKIVEGVQHAYSQINLADHQYSAFFTGPSATADVEAVRVTGAQGAIRLTAVIYNCTPAEITSTIDIPASTPVAAEAAISLRRDTDPAAGQDSV